MKVLVFGSLNIDHVYQVPHMVQGGETLLSTRVDLFCGGKGLNQAIALAKAGAPVFLAGQIGEDGQMLFDACREYGVDSTYVRVLPQPSGHTIIQIDETGQNSILLYGGTNQMQTEEGMDAVLSHFDQGDYLVLQNEINRLDYLVDRAYEKGMKIILNPSPYDERLQSCALEKVWLFLLNEIEGEQLTGEHDPDRILSALRVRYPSARFVLTLGSRGAVYADAGQKVFQDIFPVKAVDTTGAGDTFTGYFIAGLLQGKDVREIMLIAAKASSIAVSRPGAAPSIPTADEVCLQD